MDQDFFFLEVWDGGKGQGIVLFAGGGALPIFGLLVISFNFLVEIRYPYPPLDPRIIV